MLIVLWCSRSHSEQTCMNVLCWVNSLVIESQVKRGLGSSEPMSRASTKLSEADHPSLYLVWGRIKDPCRSIVRGYYRYSYESTKGKS